MIKFRIQNGSILLSLREATELPVFQTVMEKPLSGHWGSRNVHRPELKDDIPTLTIAERRLISTHHREALYRSRSIAEICDLDKHHLAIKWTKPLRPETMIDTGHTVMYINALPDAQVIGCEIHNTTRFSAILLNSGSPFIEWAFRMRAVCMEGKFGLSQESFARLLSLIEAAVQYGHRTSDLQAYVTEWSKVKDMPPSLWPPLQSITPDAFSFPTRMREARHANS